MSQTIDNRVVEMQFENKQFEQGVEQSLSTLDKLKKALKFDDAAKNLEGLSKATKQFDLQSIGEAVETLQNRFSMLGIIGMSVIQDLTNSAIGMAKKLLSAIPNQIVTGGMNRALNIEKARFQIKGLGLDVEEVMKNAQDAVSDTAYGLDEAATVAANLGASGLKAGEDMERALLAVSGAAAMTGRSYLDIGQIFSTVKSNGKLMTMQLRQFSTAGLNVAASLAESLGKTEQEINDMVAKGKIDFDTFSKAMYSAFGKHAKEANNTFTGALSNMKFALSKIGADFAAPYVDNMKYVFNAIKSFFNGWRTALAPFVKDFTWAMETVTSKAILFFGDKRWTSINETFIATLQTGLYNLVKIVGTVSYAFKNMFPEITLANFEKLLKWIQEFVEKTQISNGALESLYNIVTLLLTPVKWIVSLVIKLTTNVIVPLIVKILELTGKLIILVNVVIQFAKALKDAINNSKQFKDFLKATRTLGEKIKGIFSKIKDAFSGLFKTSGDGDRFYKVLSTIFGVLYAISNITLAGLTAAFNALSKISFTKMIDGIKLAVASVVMLIQKFLNLPIIGTIVKGITTVIGAFVLGLKTAVEWVKNFINDIINGESVFSVLKEKILGILDAFKTLKDKLSGVFDKGGFATLFKDLPEAFDDLISKITLFSDTVKTKIGDMNLSKAVMVGFAIVMIISLLNMSKAIEHAAESVSNVTGIVETLKDFFTNFTKKSTLGFTIIQIATGISMVALSLRMLADVPADKLKTIGIVLGALAGGMAVLSGVLTYLASRKNDVQVNKLVGHFKNYAGIMMSLGLGVLALAGAIKLLENVDFKQVITGIVAIFVSLWNLVGASIVLAKFAPVLSANAIAILAMAIGVSILIKSFKNLEGLDLSNIKENIKEFMLIIGALALLTIVAGGVRASGAIVLVVLANYLKSLFPLIQEIAKLDLSNFRKVIEENKKAIYTLAGFVGAFLLVIEGMMAFGGKNMMRAGVAFAALAGLALSLAGTAKIFETIEWSGIAKAAIGFVAIGTIFAIITSIMSKNAKVFGGDKDKMSFMSSNKGLGKAFLGLSVLAIALAGAAKIFSTIPFNGLVKGMIGLSAVATIFGIVSYLLTEGNKVDKGKIAGMVTVIVAIMTLVSAIVVLAGIMSASDDACKAVKEATSSLFLLMLGIAGIAAVINGKEAKSKEIQNAKTSNWKSMLIALGMMGLVAASVYGLYKAIGPDGKGWGQIGLALVVVLGSMGLVLAAISIFDKQAGHLDMGRFNEKASKQLIKWIWNFVAVFGAIEALVIVSTLVKDYDLEKAAGVLIATTALFVVVAGAAVAMLALAKKIGTNEKANDNLRKNLLYLTLAITAVGGIVVALELIPHDGSVWKKFGLLSSLLGLMGIIFAALTLASNKLKIDGSELLKMAGAFDLLAVGLVALAGVILALTKLPDIGKSTWQKFGMLSALLGEVAIIFAGFVLAMKFCELESSDLMKAAGAFDLVVVGIVALSAVMYALAKMPHMDQAIEKLVGLSVLLALIEGFLIAMVAIGAGTGGISALIGLAAGASMILAAYSLIILSNALKQLADVPWNKLKEGLAGWDTVWTFVKIIGLLLGVGIAASLGIVGLIGLTSVLIGLAACSFGLSKLAEAIAKLIEVGGSLGEIGRQVGDGLANMMQSISDNSYVIGNAIVNIIDNILMAIDNSLATIFIHLSSIFNQINDFCLAHIIPIVTNLIMALILAIGEAIDANMAQITDLATRLIVHFIDGMTIACVTHQDEINRAFESLFVMGIANARSTVTDPIKDLALHFIKQFIDVFESKKEEFKVWLLGFISDIIEHVFGDNFFSTYLDQQGALVARNFATGVANESPKTSRILKDAGKKSIQNLVDGALTEVEVKHPYLAKAGEAAANAFWKDGWRKTVGDNSPWDKAIESIKHFVDGVDLGVVQNLSSLKEAGANAALPFISAFKSLVGEEAAGTIDSLAGILNSLTFKFDNKTKAINDVVQGFNKAGYSSVELEQKLRAINQTSAETAGFTDWLAKGTETLNKIFGDGLDASNLLSGGLDGVGKSAGGAGKAVKDLGNTIQETLTNQLNIFDEYKKEDPMSPDQLIKNMTDQINGMTSWATNMDKLATQGIDQGLYMKLAEMGPQGAKYVDAFASMTAEQLAQANVLFQQSLALPGAVTAKLLTNMTTLGTNVVQGFTNGVLDPVSISNLTEAVDEMAEIPEEEISEIIEAGSPSRMTKRYGQWLDDGLSIGIINHQELVFNTVKVMVERIVKIINDGLKQDIFKEIGVNLVNGLADGLSDDQAIERLTKAANKAADIPINATKKYKEHSPSKLFYEFGKFIDLGLANGIHDYTDRIVDSSEDMSNVAINSMRNAISKISEFISDDIEDPVIKPVLDLSSVQTGARRLNSILSTNQAYAISDSINGSQSGSPTIGGTTFIQNNYSPKALSRADIYRQTRNQFSQYTNRYIQTGY